MANVLQVIPTSGADTYAGWDGGVSRDDLYSTFDIYLPAAWITALGTSGSGTLGDFVNNGDPYVVGSEFGGIFYNGTGPAWWSTLTAALITSSSTAADTWHTISIHWHKASSGSSLSFQIDGTDYGGAGGHLNNQSSGTFWGNWGGTPADTPLYFRNLKVGTTGYGSSDLFTEDLSGGDLSNFTFTNGSVSVISDPTAAATVEGRVLIAFNDGPLTASPAWTRVDGGDSPFPDNFVSGYDVEVGRQTLLSQTDTGTATVYINDYASGGLFDPRNVSSPYFGLLDGRQIMLQLYNPVTATWEDQFRGWIDDILYDVDGTGVDQNGDPINVQIQLECVDMFAFLGGFGLTPGLAGVTPPAGGEDGVWYAEGHVDDRLIEVLTDVGIPSAMYGSPSLASGNVRVRPVKYDPDESALQALRDGADAEFPFIANIYVDRHGKFQFRGRYGRFDPDAVAAEPGSAWDFTRWAAGDGPAIIADATRAQLRTFAFGRNRSDLINVAVCYPQDMPVSDMPGQVYADPTSITAYAKHDAPPMSDLLTADTGMTSGSADGKTECFKYAKLLVLNQKDPRENLTTLGFKSMRPDGTSRATQTWALLTKADISHIVNVAVGYPGGTGFTGASPDDDYYIEGRRLTVRPLNTQHDYVELTLDVSPAVWSMDLNSVFPTHDQATSNQFTSPSLTADFTYA